MKEKLKRQLPGHLHDLIPLLLRHGKMAELPAGYEILREGQYAKFVPILLSGLAKVMSRGDGKELLLYYIQPGESCIMSFIHGLHQNPSSIYATAEEDSEVLLIPVGVLTDLLNESPGFNRLFHDLSNLRYLDLLHTINQVFFENLEQRLKDYLMKRARLVNNSSLSIRHQQIADDLGTAREVISRLLKKLSVQGDIRLEKNNIYLLFV